MTMLMRIAGASVLLAIAHVRRRPCRDVHALPLQCVTMASQRPHGVVVKGPLSLLIWDLLHACLFAVHVG